MVNFAPLPVYSRCFRWHTSDNGSNSAVTVTFTSDKNESQFSLLAHQSRVETLTSLELGWQNIRVYLTGPNLHFSQYLPSRNTNCTNTHKCQRIARKKRGLTTERKKPIQHNEEKDGEKWSTVISTMFRQTFGLFGLEKESYKIVCNYKTRASINMPNANHTKCLESKSIIMTYVGR